MHLSPSEIELFISRPDHAVIRRNKRVVKIGGDFFFSFNAGDEIVHFDKAQDKVVDIDLFFFKTNDIIALPVETGFL